MGAMRVTLGWVGGETTVSFLGWNTKFLQAQWSTTEEEQATSRRTIVKIQKTS
jgi:hypothetical protein